MPRPDRDRDRPWNRELGRLNYARRRVLTFLASQSHCWEAQEIRECDRGLRRLSLELVWEALRSLVDQGLVHVSYEVDHWEAERFPHSATYPVFWHWSHTAKWRPGHGVEATSRPPRGKGGADG